MEPNILLVPAGPLGGPFSSDKFWIQRGQTEELIKFWFQTDRQT